MSIGRKMVKYSVVYSQDRIRHCSLNMETSPLLWLYKASDELVAASLSSSQHSPPYSSTLAILDSSLFFEQHRYATGPWHLLVPLPRIFFLLIFTWLVPMSLWDACS